MNDSLSSIREKIFHPLSVLGISLFAALVFAGLAILRYDGDRQFFVLYYVTPIGVPFVAFLLDRAERFGNRRIVHWLIDLLVVGFSLVRAFYPLPIISGHALFLMYALLTTHSWPARITAALIFLQVMYLKIFAWHDSTLIGGMLFGVLLGELFRLIPDRNTPWKEKP